MERLPETMGILTTLLHSSGDAMTMIRTRCLRLASVLRCAASSATAQATRDSAGIRIVDNVKPAWVPGREWRLSEKPTLDIGRGTELGRIAGATRLSDGRIVV